MNSKFMIKLALSTAVVAATTVGCASAGIGSASRVSSEKAGHSFAKKAEKALSKGKLDDAVAFAESAVGADMQNRDYRALLARTYMAQGRFASAERTLMDVVELGQVDPRTVISLALARIAQGKVDSAVALVEANRAIVPASDYGLTLALAGRSKEAVEVLGQAIRDDNANARTRQNLALAYALDGRWAAARLMAEQDMVQTDVNLRIAEWAQYARPNAYETRVAGLLKVTPSVDQGQPVRLALNAVPNGLAEAAPEAAPVAVASAEPSWAAPTTELAAVGPAPSGEDAPGFAAVEQETKIAGVVPAQVFSAPLISVPEAPVKEVATASIAPLRSRGIVHATPEQVAAAYFAQTGKTPTAAKPVKLALADTAPRASRSGGTHIVQLGAYTSAAGAQQAWAKLSRKYGALQGATSVSSVATVNGKKFVRLAAAGFEGQAAANSACRAIKAKGGDCIVKAASGQPVRFALAIGGKSSAR